MPTEPPLYSMTGFGRSQADWDQHRVTVEVSSVNSRFLDLSFHAPPGLGRLEVSARKELSRTVQRGKIRCVIRCSSVSGARSSLQLREEQLREYLRLYSEIKEKYGLDGNLTAEALLFAPEVVAPAEIDPDDVQFLEWAERLLEHAITDLNRMRAQEGEAMRRDLRERLLALSELSSRIEEIVPDARESIRQRLLSRLQECREELEMPQERILAEVALLAERSDVAEELARLSSHLQQFVDSLLQGGPVGRRLDFLSQELHREINTIGSKTNEVSISRLVLSFKEELARTREQVQNIE